MRILTRANAAIVGCVLAMAVLPVSAGAQPGPEDTDGAQPEIGNVHDCKVTSKSYGRNGSVGGKCKGSGAFQIRNLCYKTSSTSSDSKYFWGGRADAPNDTSLAVCRGAYPYMNTTRYVGFWNA